MADILGLGMSHFGGFMFPGEDMTSRVRARLNDGSLPASLDHPSKWPEAMRAEANEWSITRGGRSGRVAWQYIQDLAGRLGKRLN